MPASTTTSGYDVIGDVHGCAAELVALLKRLDYRVQDATGAYAHPTRQAIFVGDLVDRGPAQLEVLRIVKGMVDAGSAQIVMGNHEFNAVAYDTPGPGGGYLRPHTEKNAVQHRAFLEQVEGDVRAEYLDWFATMPLWMDLGGLRVVHACWHEPSMRVVEQACGSNRFTSRDQFVRATAEGDPLYEAVEVLLKGPEIDLVALGQQPYFDKDGNGRRRARVAWWDDDATTLRKLAVMGENFKTVDDEQYPLLPEMEVGEQLYAYRGDVPVFYGHYWREGHPQRGVDFTARTACVDFSAVKGGALVAYRWSGETEIREEHYVGVG
ncbi:metallophosphoesterase [Mycobacterium yunnanensis]|uniref:Metallophosphoesterase n=1 Tax=Mycobacterium yunnanensis TaxID=368477 RepID=A0A9X2Z0W1_9MYCO|nr:metallophosphoesterase [Mycobacterium yunnanensis]MCV7421409.1 metallophosphoesterase [Mycobacterium yunnanensis]